MPLIVIDPNIKEARAKLCNITIDRSCCNTKLPSEHLMYICKHNPPMQFGIEILSQLQTNQYSSLLS